MEYYIDRASKDIAKKRVTDLDKNIKVSVIEDIGPYFARIIIDRSNTNISWAKVERAVAPFV